LHCKINCSTFCFKKRFALKKNARQAKLWGKIIGSEKDYYVIEGQADGAE
jgi:hypothetical protein